MNWNTHVRHVYCTKLDGHGSYVYNILSKILYWIDFIYLYKVLYIHGTVNKFCLNFIGCWEYKDFVLLITKKKKKSNSQRS